MLIVQVLLGGITRLQVQDSLSQNGNRSWALATLNDQQWNEAFDKYKQIAQYKYLNSSFTLSDFKSIFFWEWFIVYGQDLLASLFLFRSLFF
jgi:cytochrome c oxidase assembly protein subunit 15